MHPSRLAHDIYLAPPPPPPHSSAQLSPLSLSTCTPQQRQTAEQKTIYKNKTACIFVPPFARPRSKVIERNLYLIPCLPSSPPVGEHRQTSKSADIAIPLGFTADSHTVGAEQLSEPPPPHPPHCKSDMRSRMTIIVCAELQFIV